ncbi:MAG TPA: MFS transporter [bacterium]|nr:MFS transporter [bacterium]
MNQVFILGVVSFFVDISTEMVYPILPLFLTAALKANVAMLGIIEGFAESIASILKVVSGYLSDRLQKRKFLAILGYGFSWFGKIFFLLATTWQYVFTGRLVDRIGKGVRTAPRDALIADHSPQNKRGFAYGVHRALDSLGAFAGVALLLFFVSTDSFNISDIGQYKKIFAISIIPAFIGWILLFTIKDKPAIQKKQTGINLPLKTLPKRLKMFLAFTFIFALGNSSNQFLLLKIQQETGSSVMMLVAYLIFNCIYAVGSIPCGKISDMMGQKFVLIAGYLVYGIVYWLFAAGGNIAFYMSALGLYGFYMALTDGVEKSLVSQIAPEELKGSMLGLHATLVGLGLLPASIITGFLWQTFGAAVAFGFGGSLGIFAAVGLFFIL